jgi:hypothetical protein
MFFEMDPEFLFLFFFSHCRLFLSNGLKLIRWMEKVPMDKSV